VTVIPSLGVAGTASQLPAHAYKVDWDLRKHYGTGGTGTLPRLCVCVAFRSCVWFMRVAYVELSHVVHSMNIDAYVPLATLTSSLHCMLCALLTTCCCFFYRDLLRAPVRHQYRGRHDVHPHLPRPHDGSHCLGRFVHHPWEPWHQH
jgi:hypothetical protein